MGTFRRLKQFYWPYKKYFVMSVVSLVFVTALTVIYPLILGFTVDELILGDRQHLLAVTVAFLVIVMLLKGLFQYLQQYLGELFGIHSVYEIRNELYRKLQVLPFRFYDNARTGDLMSRLAQDVEAFRFFLSMGAAQVLNFVLLTAFGFGVMLYLNVSLALITLAVMPFLAVVVYRFDKRVHPAFLEIRRSLARLTTKVQENVSGMNTVKALSKEDFEIDRFVGLNADYRDNHIKTADIWARFFPAMEFIGNVCVIVLLAYGGWLVVDGQMQPGELLAFFSLIWYIVMPLMHIGFVLNTYSQSKAAGERLLEIMDEPEDIRNIAEPIREVRLAGHVQFENVTHRYPGEDQNALQQVSFDAKPGSTIGIMGATGAGKTSITQLIARFYEPKQGRVLIDGKPVSDYDLKTLRSNIGFVLQEPFLFSASIKANISYGRPDATMEEIIDAAKRADAHEFIQELPDGYDTVLGERGGGLSGGQKQRVSIARALCVNPSILILDDATSAVDMETEVKIQAAMREVMEGRTTFIIAHRISSVKHADEIIVLDQGKVVERGTHEELVRMEHGAYRRIYDIQFQDHELVMQGKAV
ncbi:ABC transporter ATP-binding protein [Xylanibacillus composti]|uniref:Putative ABC transporter ATP-binding protein YknU n=1 Tax=Xylanibacillus composti TaxID=1572762 RepID=A0A8J4M219_9BACL|nr:ABC transporter ATP-binding protein [Xylanibacillus composti]MDT9725817.1 ABC transporter ATP-binding protein [Xylanibacillus composti]GIQ69229.1 putative ABC transporter ATP-binding protein YknU [Xylanibacillus composti]